MKTGTRQIPYPYMAHFVKDALTGAILTDAVRLVDCPRCKQEAGYHCVHPKSGKHWPPHTERTLAFSSKFGVKK